MTEADGLLGRYKTVEAAAPVLIAETEAYLARKRHQTLRKLGSFAFGCLVAYGSVISGLTHVASQEELE